MMTIAALRTGRMRGAVSSGAPTLTTRAASAITMPNAPAVICTTRLGANRATVSVLPHVALMYRWMSSVRR